MTSLLNKCFNIVAIAVIALSVSIGAASATSKNIVETAVQSGKFNTLVAALKAAGLVNTLNGKGPFTVFAPSDTAFSKLPAGTVDGLLKPENKAKLVSILAYHVIPGKIMSGDIAGKKISVKTVQGSEISVDAMYGVKINDSNVVSADIAATNGVIHVIDKVLIPN
tara:strand:- start:316 stop:813 length:498 start_codon:yes stop_codon:yes gene_type:complete